MTLQLASQMPAARWPIMQPLALATLTTIHCQMQTQLVSHVLRTLIALLDKHASITNAAAEPTLIARTHRLVRMVYAQM